MSSDLVKRMLANREFKKTIGKFTFTCRRPTDQDATEFRLGPSFACELAQRFVIDWSGVTEDDVIGGGGSDAVAFDPVAWRHWCADNKAWWSLCAKHAASIQAAEPGEVVDTDDCPDCAPLTRAITNAYSDHTKAMDDAAKNSQPA